MINQSGIYQILNTVNGKRYIGSAVCFRSRWKNHLVQFNRGTHNNKHLQRAIKLYGKEHFVFSILIICSKLDLLFYEQLCINNQPWANLYNIHPIAGSALGAKRSKETKIKMSKAQRGKVLSETTKQKLSKINTGKKLSDEIKLKISISGKGRKQPDSMRIKMTGRIISDVTRERLSQAMQGNINGKGKLCSQEKRDKISAANKGNKNALGRIVSEETRRKISESEKGKIVSQESRLKMSIAKKGKPRSKEAIAKTIETFARKRMEKMRA